MKKNIANINIIPSFRFVVQIMWIFWFIRSLIMMIRSCMCGRTFLDVFPITALIMGHVIFPTRVYCTFLIFPIFMLITPMFVRVYCSIGMISIFVMVTTRVCCRFFNMVVIIFR